MSSTTSAVSTATTSAVTHTLSAGKNLKVRTQASFAEYQLIPAFTLGCWDHPGHNEWPAHRVEFRVQEEGATALAGGRTAGRGCCVPEISEFEVICRDPLNLMWGPKATMVDRNEQYVAIMSGWTMRNAEDSLLQ